MPDDSLWQNALAEANSKYNDAEQKRLLGVLAGHAPDPATREWAGNQISPPAEPPRPRTVRLADADRDSLARYLQTPEGGGDPPELAQRIARNVQENPAGSAYLPMLKRARQMAEQTQQPDVGVLGRTMNGLSAGLGLAPDVAAQLTRQLYAPALNHPQMQRMVKNVQTRVGQLAAAPGFAMTGSTPSKPQGQPAAPQPAPIPYPMNDSAATLHVMLTQPAPTVANITDDHVRALIQDVDGDASQDK